MHKNYPITPDKGGVTFGNNIPITSFGENILSTINLMTRTGGRKTIADFAAGYGNLSVLILFAVNDSGCDLYINDIGTVALETCIKRICDIYKEFYRKFGIDLFSRVSIKCMHGDCRFLNVKTPYCNGNMIFNHDHWDLKNKIDLICALNVQHFFGPKGNSDFYKCLNFFLKPQGYAYLCNQGTLFRNDDCDCPLYQHFHKQKKLKLLYPGFTTVTQTVLVDIKTGQRIGECAYTRILKDPKIPKTTRLNRWIWKMDMI